MKRRAKNLRRIKANRFLPDYVTSFKDRHGKARLRFRRKGFEDHYFIAPLGTEEFRIEYHRCMNPDGAPKTVATRAIPGSIDDLIAQYYVPITRLGPTKTTQAKVQGIIEKFREGRGDRMVADVKFAHIDAIISKKLEKVKVGKRMEGGVEAARKLRKELVRLFDFAVKLGMIAINPVAQSERVKVAPAARSKGYHTWTEDEITQFRAYHELGTRPRLAMELMLWTDQRRIDSIHLGRQHIRGGYLELTQTKTGKEMGIPVAPQLLEAIVAMPPQQTGGMCFLVTEAGRPFTNAGFGNWFREQCDAAGLPQCSAHGLRKATMRRMAELNMGNQMMKSMSGHTKDDEVARYTADANQRRMAQQAVEALSHWEKSNLAQKLDTILPQGIENAG